MEWIKYTGLNKNILTTQSGMAKCPQCGYVFYYERGRALPPAAYRIGQSTNFPTPCPKCGCGKCKRLTLVDYIKRKSSLIQ